MYLSHRQGNMGEQPVLSQLLQLPSKPLCYGACLVATQSAPMSAKRPTQPIQNPASIGSLDHTHPKPWPMQQRASRAHGLAPKTPVAL